MRFHRTILFLCISQLSSLLAGCRPSTQHLIETNEGDLIIAAVVSNDRKIVSVTKYDDAAQLKALEIPNDASFITWSIPRAALLNKDFEPL